MSSKAFLTIGAGEISTDSKNNIELGEFSGTPTNIRHDGLEKALANARTPEEVRKELQDLGAEVYFEGEHLEQGREDKTLGNDRIPDDYKYASPYKTKDEVKRDEGMTR